MPAIHKLLVANRGEIARRVFRTCRALGIRTVAVFSDADADLPFVGEADEAVRLGPPTAAESYLHVARVLDAARRTGADAIHPGYGFLSENAAFARAVVEAGLIWVGPPPEAIEAMGDKAAARRIAVAHEVPVVPGYDGDDQDDATLVREAEAIGTPLLVKASAGGGGRGMRRVDDLADLPAALASARREAAGAFGDDRLLLERYVTRPRHIEVQILADAHGTVLHLGERDCSIQRRHQKIVEEAPSPAVDPTLRQRLGDAACRLAAAVGYVGAGTVETVLGEDGEFHFLEMNTRLQVEHPVTEEIYGIDLVAWQIAVAEGARLPWSQEALDAKRCGHAIEVRLYAEDPLRDWMPAAGRLAALHLPEAPGLRVDAGYRGGDEVSPHYDSMIAKVIASGADRAEALRRLGTALDAAWAPGLVTNLPLLRDLCRDEAFAAGALHTGFLAERGLPVAPPANLEEGAVAAVAWSWAQRPAGPGPSAWRLWGGAWEHDRFAQGEAEVEVAWRERDGGLEVRVDDGEPRRVGVGDAGPEGLVLEVDGLRRRIRVVRGQGEGPLDDGDTLYLHLGAGESMVRLVPRFPAPSGLADEPGSLTAPTPGVVRAIHVAVGDTVEEGAVLVTLESMKVEHQLRAPAAGTVTEVRCGEGEAVDGGTLLVAMDVADAE